MGSVGGVGGIGDVGDAEAAGEVGGEVRRAAARSREVADTVVAQAAATTRALRRELVEQRSAAARRRTEHEQAARSGALGAGVRRIQTRADRGETSWEAVIDGRDASADAARARADVARRLDQLGCDRPRWRDGSDEGG